MKKEIKDLQMTLVATSEKVQDLKKKVDVRELKAKVDAMNKEFEDLQNMVVTKSEKIKDLQEQVSAKMAELYLRD